jgi:hypothetical protein
MFVRKYQFEENDLAWARNGLVATLINVESIPLLQQCITDVGFEELDIIPMGEDKVFLQCLVKSDVTTVLNGAKDLFCNLFTSPA